MEIPAWKGQDLTLPISNLPAITWGLTSRLQVCLETQSNPRIDAWHIRVWHAAPRYHTASAKEYDRNHNHSCPSVTWAFRQSQALVQLPVKPFWQCQWKQQHYLQLLHMEVSPPSTQNPVPGFCLTRRWELQRQGFASWKDSANLQT